MIPSKKRVLIVDDEPAFTRLLKLNLHHTGRFTAETVNDARAAIDAADRFAPDVILLDVMMPGMDGGEVASRLQSVPSLRHVPIIFLTAAVKKQEITSHGGTLGGVPFVAKPVDFQEVLECIDQTCRKARAHSVR